MKEEESGKQEAEGEGRGVGAVFDQRGQTVGTQVNAAGDYVDRRTTVIVGDGNVVGDGSTSHVVKGGPPAPARADEGQQADDVASLRRQLAEARANLRLVEEREPEYVFGTDVPLQLVKEKRRLEERIAGLKAGRPPHFSPITGVVPDPVVWVLSDTHHSLHIGHELTKALFEGRSKGCSDDRILTTVVEVKGERLNPSPVGIGKIVVAEDASIKVPPLPVETKAFAHLA